MTAPAPRIIPARAGFTSPIWVTAFTSQDHPRSRGVYDYRPPQAAGSLGSSPLARGLPAAARPAPAPSGIIPARAGFTVS